MRKVDILKVREYLECGLLRGRLRGNELVVSYNELTMKLQKTEWDPTLKVCRGIRIHAQTGMITASNFSKFFNLGEKEVTRLENLPQEPFTVTEKLDGSLLLSAVAADGVFCHTTKASWDNDYTRAAQVYFPQLNWEDRHLSFISEIFIENDPMRRVTEREKGLHLLTVFDEMNAGAELSRQEVERLANKYNLHLVPEVKCESLQELASVLDSAKGTEGWVVKFQSGLRVKFKTCWYRAINWFLEDINDPEKARATIKEYLIGNNGSLDWISSWPEELQEEVGAIANSIIMDYLLAKKAIEGRCKVHKDLSHKDFAIKFKEDPLFHHMMSYRRGHNNWKEKLWKVV